MTVQPQQGPDDLFDIIMHGREERNIEYKASMSWKDSVTKAKVVKGCLAMSNTRDGGWIAFGVEQGKDGAFLASGMSSADAESFVQDKVQAYVNAFADPHIELKVYHKRYEFESKKSIFVVIRVPQFDQVPVICGKDGDESLRKGTIYTRPKRIPESAPVRDSGELREILDTAVDKQMRGFLTRMSEWGVMPVSGPLQDADAAAFRSEREDLDQND